MEGTRVKKSFFNAISNSGILIVRSILLFVVRIIFVKIMGKTYLGVDSLLTNILMMLSITDLGVSSAINFGLYKPLSEKNYEKVSSIMCFYKKVYNILGVIVLIIGFSLMPFLDIIIGKHINNIYLIYLLYLLTTVSTYFISYKDSLLYASQDNYKSTIIVGLTYIFMYIFRIIFLLILPSFIIYVLIQLIMLVIQRILVNKLVDKEYQVVNFKTKKKISNTEQKNILKNVKSMFMHKLGNYVVTGTDSIIISTNATLGVGLVGVYVNYISVTSVIDSIIYRALNGVTASFGDLAVQESKEVQENVFNIISFLTFLFFGIMFIGFMFLLTPFIKICFGNNFELSNSILVIICLNFYFIGTLRSLDIIKEATGIYNVDRYAPIIQAVINLIVSITLCKFLGLIGVVLGTLISTILVPLWNKPYIVYKYLFKKSMTKYMLKQGFYLLILLVVYVICLIAFNYINFSNILLDFIIRGFVLVLIFITIILIVFRKTNEFDYLLNLVKKLI